MTGPDAPALGAPRRGVRGLVDRHPLAAYGVLACGLSWSWWIPLALTGAVSRAGSPWPTHLPGLLGPALAAVAVTGLVDGRAGLADLGRRVTRWRATTGTWLVVAATLALVPLGVLVLALTGEAVPPLVAFWTFTGLGPTGLGAVGVMLVVNGLGEETGWRGFAADRLLPSHGTVRASVLVAALWALWHVPLFWVVESFRGFGPAGVVGWTLGLVAGSLVLTTLYERSGSSVLLVAAWHLAFNLTSGTPATGGPSAVVSSTLVMVAAVAIVVLGGHGSRRDGTRRPAV